MKYRLTRPVVLAVAMTVLVPVMTLFVCFFGLSVHLAMEVPLGYARLWLSPGHDVTRHVDYVLNKTEGPGRELAEKALLLRILEFDARRGSQLRYDKAALFKYAGYEMERISVEWYGEMAQGRARDLVMGDPNSSLVRAAFHYYRDDAKSQESLCDGYELLKSSGDYYNPVAVEYCPSERVRGGVGTKPQAQ